MVNGDKQRVRPDDDKSAVRQVEVRRCPGGHPVLGVHLPPEILERRRILDVPRLLQFMADRGSRATSQLQGGVTRYRP